MNIKAEDLVLNIAVNLGRVSRWAAEGRAERIRQFLKETEDYFKQLEALEVNDKFKPTLDRFKGELDSLTNKPSPTYEWAEKALTWANILTHRAKLA